ncbi:MAG: hypothetical protein WBE79_05485 [Candidatus Cybelea sp.]|jgi:hypothetical protein
MAVNVAEYMTKFQQEGLAAIKETQDASLKAMNSFSELTKQMSERPGSVPAFENIPSPTQLVELSFGFASQMLELRKAFTMRVAEMLVETQKQTEANFKAAATVANKPPVK